MSRKSLWLSVAAVLAAATAQAHDLELSGVIRDFKRGDQGGHPDFNTMNKLGRGGLTPGLMGLRLGDDGLPVYAPAPGVARVPITSPQTFAQWFRDVPGVNQSTPHTIRLTNNQGYPGGLYSFATDSFFPIDDRLSGNEGYPHNYHFTFQLRTVFSYMPGQRFKFTGDDDVWAYINGFLVIDLGGIHSAQSAEVLLFDGKAFVDPLHFLVRAGADNRVKVVSPAVADDLAGKWKTLTLEGACPIKPQDLYVDLSLNPTGADTRADFREAEASVYSTAELAAVRLVFTDGAEERFEDLRVGRRAKFTGSGANQGKPIYGAHVTVRPLAAGPTPAAGAAPLAQYFGASGAGGVPCTLDFFFAERHYSQSNFRIDTSIVLSDSPLSQKPPEPAPVAPAPPPVQVAQAPPPPPTPPPPAPEPAGFKPPPPAPAMAGTVWVSFLAALVLVVCAAVASLKSSRRGHQD